MIYESQLIETAEKLGTPDKIYLGDEVLEKKAKQLAKEVILNPLKYKDRVVFRYGHKLHEIKEAPKSKSSNTTKKEKGSE